MGWRCLGWQSSSVDPSSREANLPGEVMMICASLNPVAASGVRIWTLASPRFTLTNQAAIGKKKSACPALIVSSSALSPRGCTGPVDWPP